MLAVSGYNVITSTNTTLKFADILTAKTEMLENPYGVDLDVILMLHRSYADLVLDPEFKTYAQTGKSNVVNTGDIGMEVDGLTIKIIPEVDDNVYLIDTDLQPIVLVQIDGVHVESVTRNSGRCFRPNFIWKISLDQMQLLKLLLIGWMFYQKEHSQEVGTHSMDIHLDK